MNYERIAAYVLPQPFCDMHNGNGWLDEALCELLSPGSLEEVRKVYEKMKKELADELLFQLKYNQLKDEPEKQARLTILYQGSKLTWE